MSHHRWPILYDHALTILNNRHQAQHITPDTWETLARPEQLLPVDNKKDSTTPWRTWLILAGRGFGKTRTGAQAVKKLVEEQGYRRVAFIGQSVHEARQVMIEGASGLLSCYDSPDHQLLSQPWREDLALPPFEENQKRPTFFPSRRVVEWPNKAVGQLFGADFYDKLRGPQFDLVWIDELAKFHYPRLLWEQVEMGLRLGPNPKCIITTTPRPLALLEDLCKEKSCIVTTGSTFDNAKNLAPGFLDHMEKFYANTSLGQQELYGRILTQRVGALWTRSMITYQDIDRAQFQRVVVAVDPAITCNHNSDETGIVVVARTTNGIGVVLEDLSGHFPPSDWTKRVVEAYWRHQADRVVAEMNKGGDMVEKMLKTIDPTVSFKGVHATRGKITRAEPVAALYEQGKIVHLRSFTKLEDQLCDYTPTTTSYSPDRLDALVWGMSELFLGISPQEVRVWG